MVSGPPVMGNIYAITISLWQYLLLTGTGFARNTSFSVAANTTVQSGNQPVASKVVPDTNNPTILLHSVEFDGIQSGLVGFSFILNGNELAGYAQQGTEQIYDMFCNGEMAYSIQNNQTTPIVVNFDYLTIPQNIADIDVLGPLFSVRPGGPFGVVLG